MSAWKRGLVTDLGYELWLWGSVAVVLVCTITFSIFACIRSAKVSCGGSMSICRGSGFWLSGVLQLWFVRNLSFV